MLYISDLWEAILFSISKIECDMRLTRTHDEGCGSMRCCDPGSLPGGGGLELGSHRNGGTYSSGREQH